MIILAFFFFFWTSTDQGKWVIFPSSSFPLLVSLENNSFADSRGWDYSPIYKIHLSVLKWTNMPEK